MELLIAGVLILVVGSFIFALVEMAVKAMWPLLKWGLLLMLLPITWPYLLFLVVRATYRGLRAPPASTPGCEVYRFPDRT